MYLNTIYFGHGTYGIEAAAQTYFGKSPALLDLAEASVLAGLIAAPEYYSPIRHLDRAKVRQGYVLGQMVSKGWITRAEGQKALDEKLSLKKVRKSSVTFSDAPYFISNILFSQLLPRYGSDAIYRGGMRIYTTLDFDLQRDAEEAIGSFLPRGRSLPWIRRREKSWRWWAGRILKKASSTGSHRHSASRVPPLSRLSMRLRWRRDIARSTICLTPPWNSRTAGSRGNYDMKSHGEVSLVEALTYSYNIPTVKLAHLTGLENVTRMARNLGITTPHLPNDLSLALGSTSVTPLEMAVAYSCFENGGKRVVPYAIREVRDNGDSVLEKNGPTVSEGCRPRSP